MFRHTLTMTAALALAASVGAGAQQARPAKAPSLTPQQTLEKLTWEGAAARYPASGPQCP